MHQKTRRVGFGLVTLGLGLMSYVYLALPFGSCTEYVYKGKVPEPGFRGLNGLDVVYSTNGTIECELSILYFAVPILIALAGTIVLIVGQIKE